MDPVRGLLVVLVTAVAGCGTDPSPVTATTTTAPISTAPMSTAQQVVDEARLELGAPGLLAAVARGHERTSVVSGAGDRAGTPSRAGRPCRSGA